MRGEILYYDEGQGFGFIHGADGKRYGFAAEDVRHRAKLTPDTTVEFQPKGDKARNVVAVHAQAAERPVDRPAGAPPTVRTAASASDAPAPPHFGRLAVDGGDGEPTGLWGYCLRALTGKYASFSGRARRKEYWGYYLFWTLALLAVCVISLIADSAAGNLDRSDGPVLTMVAFGFFILATFLPGLAITIRRIHDIGLSGWFYLLIFIPSIGMLIILVFALIPSQKKDNRWGPVPEGVRS